MNANVVTLTVATASTGAAAFNIVCSKVTAVAHPSIAAMPVATFSASTSVETLVKNPTTTVLILSALTVPATGLPVTGLPVVGATSATTTFAFSYATPLALKDTIVVTLPKGYTAAGSVCSLTATNNAAVFNLGAAVIATNVLTLPVTGLPTAALPAAVSFACTLITAPAAAQDASVVGIETVQTSVTATPNTLQAIGVATAAVTAAPAAPTAVTAVSTTVPAATVWAAAGVTAPVTFNFTPTTPLTTTDSIIIALPNGWTVASPSTQGSACTIGTPTTAAANVVSGSKSVAVSAAVGTFAAPVTAIAITLAAPLPAVGSQVSFSAGTCAATTAAPCFGASPAVQTGVTYYVLTASTTGITVGATAAATAPLTAFLGVNVSVDFQVGSTITITSTATAAAVTVICPLVSIIQAATGAATGGFISTTKDVTPVALAACVGTCAAPGPAPTPSAAGSTIKAAVVLTRTPVATAVLTATEMLAFGAAYKTTLGATCFSAVSDAGQYSLTSSTPYLAARLRRVNILAAGLTVTTTITPVVGTTADVLLATLKTAQAGTALSAALSTAASGATVASFVTPTIVAPTTSASSSSAASIFVTVCVALLAVLMQ